jgi:prepilin signal peptidase PulO-like enzyme (type II secretory pathway)
LRLLAVILLVLALVRLFGAYQFPLVSASTAFVAVWMGALGMLGLVVSAEPLRVAPAILTILAGFDLVYGGLQQSLTVVGFWSALTILAALALSYLALVQGLTKEQSQQDDGGLGL